SFADQVGGAVDQVAALGDQGIHLFAAGGTCVFERGDAGQGTVGQVGLHLGLAEAQFLAGGGGGFACGGTGVAGGVAGMAAGLAQVGFHAVGGGRAHLRGLPWGGVRFTILHGDPARPCQRISRLPGRLPRRTRRTSWSGAGEKPSRKPARSSKRPPVVATTTSPGRRPLAAARLPSATDSTSTPPSPA